jgi:hypothetical protein
MSEPQSSTSLPITVFYTVSLRGELRLLPYLFSHIKQQRAAVSEQGGISLLVDLGESCRMDWPICRLTEGRALLVAMDAMGYDAFHLSVDEPLLTDEVMQTRLRNTVLSAVLVAGESKIVTKKIADEQYLKVRIGGGDVSLEPTPEAALTLQLQRGLPLASRLLEDHTVLIEDQRQDRIPPLGRVDLRLDRGSGALQLLEVQRLPIPAGIMPEPSITSIVEFVESEVQLAARNKDRPAFNE